MLDLAELTHPTPAVESRATVDTHAERDAGGDATDSELLETIGSYRVHPMASMFPLLTGFEFDEFVESIRVAGRISEPLEVHEGLLISGRNRLRAVEALRIRGVDIEAPVIEWESRGAETVEEHIYAVNVHRRHLTDDQRAVLATTMLPSIRAACAARQVASRFHVAQSSDGNAVAQISVPPQGGPVAGRQSSEERFRRSAVGVFCDLANVSRHKATQAITLADNVAAGAVPLAEMKKVIDGEIPLRKVSRRRKRVTAPQVRKPVVPVPTDAAAMFDDEPDPCDEPTVSDEEVRRRWEALKHPFAVSDHRELRRLMVTIIAEEQRTFDV